MIFIMILICVLAYVLYLNIFTNKQIIQTEARTNLLILINTPIDHTHTADPRTHTYKHKSPSAHVTHTRGTHSSMLSHLSYKGDSLSSRTYQYQQCSDDACAWCGMYMFDELVRGNKGEPVHHMRQQVDTEDTITAPVYGKPYTREKWTHCDSKKKSRYDRKGTKRQRRAIRAAKAYV